MKKHKKYRLKPKARRVLISSILVLIAGLLSIVLFNNGTNILNSVKNYFAAGDIPAHSKTITDNEDGTHKLHLTIQGEAEKKPSKVNIIVIVDRSGSMSEPSGTGAYVASNSTWEDMYGFIDGEYVGLTRHGGSGNRYYTYRNDQGQDVRYDGQRYYYDASATRLQATQSAVNSLANTLLSYNGKDDNPDDTVEMALVSFATNASTDRNPTTSSSSFISAVSALDDGGGTNWEAALQEANTINFGDDDPTYVIFFSDGSPTFHSSNGGYNNWNRDYGVYGSGYEQEPNMERSYTQAVDDATALASKFGASNFYTIFAYGTNVGAGYMSDLTEAAGAPAGNNYSASSTAELQAAFDEILKNIEMSGIGNVSIEDGTTSKVTTSSGVAHLLEVDKDSFQYWKTVNGQRTEWKSTDEPAPPAATFDPATGNINWDLSSLGVLENGVTYEVTVDVYPSQETYDLIADLKNGTKDYNNNEDVDPEVRKYLHKNGNSYTLDTNTVDANGYSTATVTYTDTRTDDGEQTARYTNPKPVATEATPISIEKKWDNDLDQREHFPVQVNLQRDGVNFYPTTLDSSNGWKAENINIAVGLARLNGDKLTILDPGHDYKFAELGSESYNWELETETAHPMLINGNSNKISISRR